MSRHVVKIFLFLAVAVLFTAALAPAEQAKMINIYADAVLPNGQQLKAGKYQVALDEGAKQVSFKKGDKVVATAGCRFVDNPQKNPFNEARFDEKDAKPQLQELRFRGEQRSIMLTPEGTGSLGR